MRNSIYAYVAEIFRWFQEHDTISPRELWDLLGNVFTAGSSAPDYPTSLYRSAVIDFIYEHHKEEFEKKIKTPGYYGIMPDDSYVLKWSHDHEDVNGTESKDE